MKKKDMQAIVKLIGEINQLGDKNKTQVNFLDALGETTKDTESLTDILRKDSLIDNTTISQYTVKNIRLDPEEWREVGIRLGDDWNKLK